MTYTAQYLAEVGEILQRLDRDPVDCVLELPTSPPGRGGRLFILGSEVAPRTRSMTSPRSPASKRARAWNARVVIRSSSIDSMRSLGAAER